MLTTDDVLSTVFGPMRTAYGGQWKHGDAAAKVWRNALSRYPRDRIEGAVSQSMERYIHHPPTLPQFLELVRPDQRINTYLPAPQMSAEKSNANRIMLRVLSAIGGVDKHTLANMVALQNALIEEPDMEAPELRRQLTELAANHDREAKARETEAARQVFCRKQGIRYVEVAR